MFFDNCHFFTQFSRVVRPNTSSAAANNYEIKIVLQLSLLNNHKYANHTNSTNFLRENSYWLLLVKFVLIGAFVITHPKLIVPFAMSISNQPKPISNTPMARRM